MVFIFLRDYKEAMVFIFLRDHKELMVFIFQGGYGFYIS